VRVAFGSLARSPGATTTLLAAAAVWPTAEMVVVEADSDGGVLAARFGLSLHPEAPTLMSLLAATRHDPAAGVLDARAQRLPGGLPVVCAPSIAEIAALAVAQLADRFGVLTSSPAGDVLVDVGRLRPSSAAWRLASSCDVLVVVMRPVVEELEPLLGRLDSLTGLRPVLVALRGTGPYGAAEVIDAVGARAGVCSLPEDGRGVAVMYGHRAGRLDRTALVRSARRLVDAVARPGERVR
jgi:hypothetical protein